MNPERLAAACHGAVSDAAVLAERGALARERAVTEFSVAKVVARYGALYREVAAERR